MSGKQRFDLTGQQFGERTVLVRVPPRLGTLTDRWLCRCACGREDEVDGTQLRRGRGQSCWPCSRRHVGDLNRKHGLAKSPEYRALRSAEWRCTNQDGQSARDYAARGIEFRLPSDPAEATATLTAAIGPRPTSRHTLDRIDNNGHYEIGNLRWATWSEQNRNKRSGRRTAA